MRIRLVVLLACLSFLPAGLETEAAGTIRTTDATIAAGSASTQGTVTIDPDLTGGTQPTIPPVGILMAMSPMPGSMPSFPGGGNGTNAYDASSDDTLSAGTYEYTTFRIQDGKTVTVTGPVTIKTTGNVTINGKLQSTAASASITIHCGGDMDMIGPSSQAGGILTAETGAPIDVHVAGALNANNRVDIKADKSDISFHVHEASSSGTTFTTEGTWFKADGSLTVRALGDMVLDGTFDSDGGTTVQSREGEISFGSTTFVESGEDGHVNVEAHTEVLVQGGSYVQARNGNLRIAAHGGDVVCVESGDIASTFGVVTLEASGWVVVTDGTQVQSYNNAVRLVAHTGDVRVGVDKSDNEDGAYVEAHTSQQGNLDITTNENVWIGGDARVEAHRACRIKAIGGWYRQTSDARVSGDTVDIRASDAISADPGTGSAAIMANETDVDLSAGDGGVAIDLGNRLTVGFEGSGGNTGGWLNIVTSGPVRMRGIIEANEGIHVATTHPSIDMTDVSMRTFYAGVGDPSGSILIESWAQVDGLIDATRASVASGDGFQSGDVTICIRSAGGEPIEDAIEAFILPKTIKVKINADKPEKSKFKAVGYFDTGPDVPVLTGPATLIVGGLVFDIPGLTERGRTYRYDGNGVALRIKKRKNGSSRAKFLLKMKRDMSGQIDPDAVLDIEFTTGDLTGSASVGLTKGRFRLGKTKGLLFAPALYLQKAKCKLKDGAEDKLKLTLGLSTDGITPAAASDVRVRMGTAVDVTIPAASFERDGDRWIFDGEMGGITDVVLDYGKEIITIKGKRMALTDYPDGANAEAVAVDVGTDTRAVSVRMVRSGKSMKY